MRVILGQLAHASASRIAAWTVGHVNADQREWAEAHRAEMQAMESGWHQLMWAAGGIRLMLHLRAERPAPTSAALAGSVLMNRNHADGLGGWLTPLGRNLLALLIAYLVLLISVMAGNRLSPTANVTMTSMVVAMLVGIVPAVLLRARVVACLLAGQGAFGVTEVAAHAMWGIDKVQGGQAHWSVMVAATVAAFSCALIQRHRGAAPVRPIWDARDLVGSANRAAAAMGARVAGAALVVTALGAVVVTESLVHLLFGAQPFRDGYAHVAIVVAAALGAGMGAMIESSVMRLAMPRGNTAAA